MTVSSYILSNNLPCKSWLNFTDKSSIFTIGNTFNVANQINNGNYSFLQNDPAQHPINTSEGITFATNKKIYPQNNNLFDNSVQSYSIILAFKGTSTSEQNLISVSKQNPLLPKNLEYKYKDNASNQQFSILNLQQKLYSEEYDRNNIQIFMVSHNIKYGITKFSVDKDPFVTKINNDRGYMLNNMSTFYIGNSIDSIPFTGNLLHFLMFVPEISDVHMLNLATQLVNVSPILDAKSEELVFSTTLSLSANVGVTFNPSYVFSYPILLNYSSTNTLDASIFSNLVLSYVWSDLVTDQWNNMTTSSWDGLL